MGGRLPSEECSRRVLNQALETELSEHLGYQAGEAPHGGAGNARNGKPGKTILTDQGPLRIRSPRDRKGTFEPQIVKQRQTSRAAARRGTYEILAAQWPYSEGPIAARLNGTRNHIASATLDRVEWNNSTLITGNGTEHWQAPLRRRHDPCGREAHQQQGLQDRGHDQHLRTGQRDRARVDGVREPTEAELGAAPTPHGGLANVRQSSGSDRGPK
jgi:hypothetical protein